MRDSSFVGEFEITLRCADDCIEGYTFREWSEVPLTLEISYSNPSQDITLPVMNKQEWGEFKRAGDRAFMLMEDNQHVR